MKKKWILVFIFLALIFVPVALAAISARYNVASTQSEVCSIAAGTDGFIFLDTGHVENTTDFTLFSLSAIDADYQSNARALRVHMILTNVAACKEAFNYLYIAIDATGGTLTKSDPYPSMPTLSLSTPEIWFDMNPADATADIIVTEYRYQVEDLLDGDPQFWIEVLPMTHNIT